MKKWISIVLSMVFLIALPAWAQEATPEATSDYQGAEWTHTALTNVRTGDTFTLADYAGKIVYVEPMATWCPLCRVQLGYDQAARSQVDTDNVVFIGLSLEIGLSDSDLANYADQNGFDMDFAVMPQEMLPLLADDFGREVASAPSTPHFIIYPDGTFSELSTGYDQTATAGGRPDVADRPVYQPRRRLSGA